jgi:hypothetical protein
MRKRIAKWKMQNAKRKMEGEGRDVRDDSATPWEVAIVRCIAQ